MEILFEILFCVLEVFAELLLQIFFELFAEVGLRALSEPFGPKKPMNPWLSAACYLALGVFAGRVSVLLLPHSFISSHTGRVLNVVITPFIAGGVMAVIGAWRRRRGSELIRLDRFAYGYLFALAMAIARFVGVG